MTSKSGLDIMGLPNLFQSIANDRKTGTLTIQGVDEEKYIFFREGDIQQVSSSQRPSILGEGLRRHPELDEDSYQEMCRQQRETGQSLASLLLSDEEDGKEMVIAVCQFQISEEICELFTWGEDYHCEMIEGTPSAMLFDMELIDIDMAMNTGMLLFEGARRYDEWSIILEKVPSKKNIPYLKSQPKEPSAEASMVINNIDGFRDVEEILEKVRLSPFGAMKIISEMVEADLIGFKSGAELIQMARLDVLRENKLKCIKLYERAEELGETSSDVVQWLAHSYEAMGMRDNAIDKYRELGYMYLSDREYGTAANSFEMVTNLQPNDMETQERLVTLLCQMEAFEDYASKTTTYSRWLALNNDRRRAILLLEEATEKYKFNLTGLDFLGSLHQEDGDRENAINAYKNLAKVKLKKEDQQGAIDTYQKIILLDQENIDARKSIAEIYTELGNEREAMENYRAIGRKIIAMGGMEDDKLAEDLAFVSVKIIDETPDSLEAREWLAKAHIAQGKKQQAISELEQLLKHVDDKKDISVLVDTLKALVSLCPNDFDKRLRLAETYLKIKREREASQEYYELGVAAAEQGKIPVALNAFEKLLAHEPANYATRLKKAEILTAEGKNEEAIYQLMLTGYLSMGSDKLWQAVKAFRQVLTLDRESQVQCYLELARVYEKLGKNKESLAAYKKHIQKSVKRSNFSDALISCDHILKIDPGHEWAAAAKQKLVDILPKINQVFQESVN